VRRKTSKCLLVSDATIARRVNILFASETEKAEFWLPLLQQALPQDRFFTEEQKSIDVALVATPPAGTLRHLKDAKLIQSLWMGVEKLLADPELPKGVPLARLIDPGMVAAMSETVLGHVLDWHRHLYRYRAYQSQVQWRRHKQYLASDRTVGILGLGELGSDAAKKLLALGFKVAGWSRRPKQVLQVESFSDPEGLEKMLQKTDSLVCLLPLTAQTRGILNAKTLGLLKKHACLINLARGGHLVIDDLLRLLDSGHLAHAYLDVFDKEPLPAASPLWKHPGVTVTPHSAALTEPRTAVAKIVDNIERVRRGETPLHLVDFAAGY
jgi:glyoxylate/hydroxypyruvate reductase A